MRLRIVLYTSGLLVAALAGVVYIAYARQVGPKRDTLAANGQLAETPCGTIEYITYGEGTPVLVVHGAGGGFDQGQLMAEPLGDGFRYIIPSRFGYLGTPLPADASAAAQAEAHACLLDTLGIDRVAVMGASMGAMSSMEFALRYPERTSALVLIVPIAYAPPDTRTLTDPDSMGPNPFVANVLLQSDFAGWLMTTLGQDMVKQRLLGVPAALEPSLTDADRARVQQMMDVLHPISQRSAGILHDAEASRIEAPYPLDQIVTPTLVVSAADDPYGTLAGARYTAEHLPNARLIALDDGGHLLLGHTGEVYGEIHAFLRANA